MCVVVSHVSAVQITPSLHCALVVQHPAIAALLHVCVAALHVSAVQAFESLQPALVTQQPGIAVITHWFVTRLQTSIVQTFASLHCAFVVHASNATLPVAGASAWQPTSNAVAITTALPTCPIVKTSIRAGPRMAELPTRRQHYRVCPT